MKYFRPGRHRAGRRPWQITDWDTGGKWLTADIYPRAFPYTASTTLPVPT